MSQSPVLMSPLYALAVSWIVAYKSATIGGWALLAAEGPPGQELFAPAAAELEFSGEAVDGDMPVTYRLPGVPAAAPAAPVAIHSQPLFSPPRRQFVEPVLPMPPNQTTLDYVPAVAPPVDPLPPQRIELPPTPVASPPDDDAGMPVDIELPAEPAHGLPGMPIDSPPIETAPIAAAPAGVARPAPHAPQLAVQMLPAVQRGYALAQRGAMFAARTEFVQVLRRVAQAKDMAANTDEYSQALAAGWRAIDEAHDFVPEGVQLEAELNVRKTASSHRTPALDEANEKLLPHEAVLLYHAFAREQLAKAVGGEQAGSMALYGLGRIDAQLAARKHDDVRHVRDAMTMYAAALEACPSNHLAANELGVLECRTGRPGEAARLFERTIDFAPSATAYHNLAVAQQKIGLHEHAQANEQESQRLAAMERAGGALSRRAGVEWVSPEEMARVAQPGGGLTAPPPTQAATEEPASKWPWQRAVDYARGVPRSRAESDVSAPQGPSASERIARPMTGPNHWRR